MRTALLFAHSSEHRCKIVEHNWRSVHQRYLFINSKHNKSDAFQVTTQLLVMTPTEIHMRTEAVRAKTNIKFERCDIKFL